MTAWNPARMPVRKPARRGAVSALCALFTLAALAAGCASTPASRYYTLSSIAAPGPAVAIVGPAVATVGPSVGPAAGTSAGPAGASPAAAAPGIAIDVGPVSVPALVDRPQIVVSAGANEVRLEEFNRWAAPLQENLSRVIADNLLALLGAARASAFPQTLGTAADYRVAIEVQRFESVPGISAALDAAWTVRRAKDGREQRGRSSVREQVQGAGYEALAAAHSRAAARMSQDIADAIRALEKP